MPNLKEILELAETSRRSADLGLDYWHGVADALEWATGNRQAAPGETPTDAKEFYDTHIAHSASFALEESISGPLSFPQPPKEKT